MILPVWAIVLLGLGWLGFLWLLLRRDGGRDLTRAPVAMPRPGSTLPASPGRDDLPPDLVAELRQLVAQGQKIHAIKRLREHTRCSLGEAKSWVERL